MFLVFRYLLLKFILVKVLEEWRETGTLGDNVTPPGRAQVMHISSKTSQLLQLILLSLSIYQLRYNAFIACQSSFGVASCLPCRSHRSARLGWCWNWKRWNFRPWSIQWRIRQHSSYWEPRGCNPGEDYSSSINLITGPALGVLAEPFSGVQQSAQDRSVLLSAAEQTDANPESSTDFLIAQSKEGAVPP